MLTHWGRATHICAGKLTIIGSDNGLSPGRRQAIIWTNVGILLIGPLRTNLSEILIGIQTFSFRKMHLKISSATWRPFCLGLNELMINTLSLKRKVSRLAGIFLCIFIIENFCDSNSTEIWPFRSNRVVFLSELVKIINGLVLNTNHFNSLRLSDTYMRR